MHHFKVERNSIDWVLRNGVSPNQAIEHKLIGLEKVIKNKLGIVNIPSLRNSAKRDQFSNSEIFRNQSLEDNLGMEDLELSHGGASFQ